MACPYFLPTERLDAELWPHRHRLPLGDGWRGECAIGAAPDQERLRESCNLGYATRCPHLPADREADAVRFSIAGEGECIRVFYLYERGHLPGKNGTLKFDSMRREWILGPSDSCLRRQAECFLMAYLKWRHR